MPRGKGLGSLAFGLGLVASLLTLYVNTMGFVDADTGSAFGCGHQWFTCNGQIIPALNGLQVIIEFSHRLGVPVLTVFLLATAVLAGFRYRKWREIPILAGASVFFVLLEALLGGIAVMWNEPPAVIATHFGVSLLAFSSIVLLTIYIWRVERVREASYSVGKPLPLREELPKPEYRRSTWMAIPYLYVAMYVGAYISSAELGSQFRGWPIPTENPTTHGDALSLDWLHRLLALVLVIWMVYLFVQAYRMRRERQDLYRGSIFALSFVVLQAFSGVYLVETHVNLPAFLIHVSVITGLFTTLCFLAVQTLPPWQHRVREKSQSIPEVSPSNGSRI